MARSERYEMVEELGYTPVGELSPAARADFVRKTYAHLFAAIVSFVLLEYMFFSLGWARPMARAMLGTSWLLVLGGFILVGWFASRTAHIAETKLLQYLALALFTVAEAIIFVPLLVVADAYAPGVISSAAAVTLAGFTGLSAIAILTGKDFSFLRGFLFWGMLCALLLIIGGVIFGFKLGLYFSIAMVVLAGAAILYDTSNILHHYPEDRYVGAALELFASVALLFWYVIQIFLLSRD